MWKYVLMFIIAQSQGLFFQKQKRYVCVHACKYASVCVLSRCVTLSRIRSARQTPAQSQWLFFQKQKRYVCVHACSSVRARYMCHLIKEKTARPTPGNHSGYPSRSIMIMNKYVCDRTSKNVLLLVPFSHYFAHVCNFEINCASAYKCCVQMFILCT